MNLQQQIIDDLIMSADEQTLFKMMFWYLGESRVELADRIANLDEKIINQFITTFTHENPNN